MRLRDLKRMADEYQSEHGFKPGALVFGEEDVPEILELLSDVVEPAAYEVFKAEYEKTPKLLQRRRIAGLALLLEKEAGIRLDRHDGAFTAIRPQGASEFYNPHSDVVNSAGSVIRAALSFFDKTGFSEELVLFGKGLGAFLVGAGEGGRSWEEEALPELERMLDGLGDTEERRVFLLRFFMSFMDFYWHCCRMNPKDAEAKDRDLFEKALNISALCRTMPPYMRTAYLDHLGTHGMTPKLFAKNNKD